MARAGVPESWLAFPIGTLKTAGAAGLPVGLAGDYSPQFGLAIGFLSLAVATLGLGPPSALERV